MYSSKCSATEVQTLNIATLQQSFTTVEKSTEELFLSSVENTGRKYNPCRNAEEKYESSRFEKVFVSVRSGIIDDRIKYFFPHI